jgi:apolipoprotein N-acyltransferase
VRRRVTLLLAAVASGLLFAAALPPAELWWVAWVAWVPWVLALGRGPSLLEGAVSGAALLVALHAAALPWILHVLSVHAGMSAWAARGSFAAALLVLAPYGAILGAMGAAWGARHGVAGLAGLAVAWPALDALRARLPLGFAWCVPGMTQAPVRSVLGIADLGGVHALSAVILLCNVGVAVVAARAWASRRQAARAPGGRIRPGLLVPAIAAVALVLTVSYGAVTARRHAAPAARSAAGVIGPMQGRVVPLRALRPPWSGARERDVVRVAAVQASIPQEVVLAMDPAADDDRARLQLELTRAALLRGPDLVAWSESGQPGVMGFPVAVVSRPWVVEALRGMLAAAGDGAPPPECVTGAIVALGFADGRWHSTNSVVLVDRDGLAGRYDKVHLVPFGEYLPAARVFSWFRRVVAAIGDLRTGGEALPLPSAHGRLGALVCYEAVLPQHAGLLVRRGADLLVGVTNDGWFHGTAAPRQHLLFSVLRAVETRRWVVRCANSGISAVVAPDGAVVAEMAEGQRGLLLAEVARRRELTLYVRCGDAPLFLLGACALGWMVWAVLTARRDTAGAER